MLINVKGNLGWLISEPGGGPGIVNCSAANITEITFWNSKSMENIIRPTVKSDLISS